MGKDNCGSSITRRAFLRRAAASAAVGVGVASGLKLGAGRGYAAETASEAEAGSGVMKQRTLGRTGLKVGELGMGTIGIQNPAVARRALDMGVNFFDTAACYQAGTSEVQVGKALKGVRERAIVATKWHTDGTTPAADLLKSVDGSLERLGMDYIDVIQVHGAWEPKHLTSDEVWEAFTRAKEAGKVRFNGFTIHEGQASLIGVALETGRYDTVMVSYNALVADQVRGSLAQAREAGMGTVAMKALQPAHEGKGQEAFAGLPGSPYQQAIRWVLKDANVSSVVVDMPTFEQLDEDHAAAVNGATRAEMEAFEGAVSRIAVGTCHMCGTCTRQCRRGVRVNDIMRYVLYHEGYGNEGRAVDLYRAMPAAATAAMCLDCSECSVVCPWGVPVKSRMERAHVRLA